MFRQVRQEENGESYQTQNNPNTDALDFGNTIPLRLSGFDHRLALDYTFSGGTSVNYDPSFNPGATIINSNTLFQPLAYLSPTAIDTTNEKLDISHPENDPFKSTNRITFSTPHVKFSFFNICGHSTLAGYPRLFSLVCDAIQQNQKIESVDFTGHDLKRLQPTDRQRLFTILDNHQTIQKYDLTSNNLSPEELMFSKKGYVTNNNSDLASRLSSAIEQNNQYQQQQALQNPNLLPGKDDFDPLSFLVDDTTTNTSTVTAALSSSATTQNCQQKK